MDTLKALFTRRSIRKYQAKPVPSEVVTRALKAAMSAPSAGNEQAWQFIVLDQRALLDAVPAVHPHSKMITQVPVAVLVCGDLRRETHPGYWTQDCAAATLSLLLAVHAQGYGAVWLGVYPRNDRVQGLRRLLGVPEEVIPFALVPIGRPAETKGAEDRFDPARVHWNQW